MNQKNEIVLYKPDDTVQLEVMVENETVWLSQAQMSLLFDKNKRTISEHINNIFKEKELDEKSVVRKNRTTASDGKTYDVNFYSLDVVISVGYRVKSQRGTEFRIWATKTLRDYILKGYVISQRFERLEYRVAETERKIDFFVKTALPPVEGVFYAGQIFYAYRFISDLIKSARSSIALFDNYLDESVFTLFSKRNAGVNVTIYTASLSTQLRLDITKHNAQYSAIIIKTIKNIHDRFLLIDDDVFHIGASLKDLGKNLFAFTKMEMKASEFMKNIK